METRSIFVGIILCVLGLVLFIYGTSNINFTNAVANTLFTVFGLFLGMAGLLVLSFSLFRSGA